MSMPPASDQLLREEGQELIALRRAQLVAIVPGSECIECIVFVWSCGVESEIRSG